MHMQTDMQIQIQTGRHRDTTYTDRHVDTGTHWETQIQIQTGKQADSYALRHTHVHTRMHIFYILFNGCKYSLFAFDTNFYVTFISGNITIIRHTYTRARAHAHTHTHTQEQEHEHAHAHTHTHTHMHIHIHTHTHTHTDTVTHKNIHIIYYYEASNLYFLKVMRYGQQYAMMQTTKK